MHNMVLGYGMNISRVTMGRLKECMKPWLNHETWATYVLALTGVVPIDGWARGRLMRRMSSLITFDESMDGLLGHFLPIIDSLAGFGQQWDYREPGRPYILHPNQRSWPIRDMRIKNVRNRVDLFLVPLVWQLTRLHAYVVGSTSSWVGSANGCGSERAIWVWIVQCWSGPRSRVSTDPS